MKSRLLIGGLLAAGLSGAWTAYLLGHAEVLPRPLRGYALQACALGFIAGGLVLGASLRGRGREAWAFGASAALPGFTVPLLLVATQGLHGSVDLFLAQFLLPALAHAGMGFLGGLAARLGPRRSAWIGASFAAGVFLGPLIVALVARRLAWGFPAVVTVLLGVPWITGAFALSAWMGRASDADRARRERS